MDSHRKRHIIKGILAVAVQDATSNRILDDEYASLCLSFAMVLCPCYVHNDKSQRRTCLHVYAPLLFLY